MPTPPAPQQLPRALGLWDLVLLNVVAIVGLRWLSTAAQLGPSSLLLWLLAMLVFFIPSGLAVMALSSRLPGEGGIYLWAREAFGDHHGFLAGWAYWVSNLVYFPSLLIFMAGSFLYANADAWLGLAESQRYNLLFSIAVLWLALGLNMIGLSRGKWVQNLGAVGTWLAAALLLGFGLLAWLRSGSATSFESAALLPDLADLGTLTFFSTMAFGFAGLELAPIMGDEIRDPRRNLPRALLISGLLIAGVYVGGTAVLLAAVPEQRVDLITGVPQALAAVGEQAGVPGLGRVAALLITLGGLGGIGAWVAGTARIPYVVGVDRYLPAALSRVHPRWGTPHVALLVQGVLCTLLLLAAAAGGNVAEAYEVLLDMTIVLYFIPFLYMFAALPRLRRQARAAGGHLDVPGGTTGAWLISLLGLGSTLLALLLAVLPSDEIRSPWLYELKLLGGCGLLLAAGVFFYRRGRRQAA